MTKSTQPGASALFDKLIETMGLKNDAALARVLEVQPPVISKIRHGKLLFGDSLILRVHENCGIAVTVIRSALARKAEQ